MYIQSSPRRSSERARTVIVPPTLKVAASAVPGPQLPSRVPASLLAIGEVCTTGAPDALEGRKPYKALRLEPSCALVRNQRATATGQPRDTQ